MVKALITITRSALRRAVEEVVIAYFKVIFWHSPEGLRKTYR